MAAEGVTEAELSKAKNTYRANTINGRQSTLNLAEAVQFAELFLGGVDKVNTDLARYNAVTAADIKRGAATYLRADNSLTIVIVPGAK